MPAFRTVVQILMVTCGFDTNGNLLFLNACKMALTNPYWWCMCCITSLTGLYETVPPNPAERLHHSSVLSRTLSQHKKHVSFLRLPSKSLVRVLFQIYIFRNGSETVCFIYGIYLIYMNSLVLESILLVLQYVCSKELIEIANDHKILKASAMFSWKVLVKLFSTCHQCYRFPYHLSNVYFVKSLFV
jgi:hypothetical protein